MTTERERYQAWLDAAYSYVSAEFAGAAWYGWQARAALAQPAQAVAWATPSLLATLSAVEKNYLTNPDRRKRGGEFESAARDAERYSVPLYAAPQPAPAAQADQRSTDGAGAREGNERGHCAEGAPVRLPDKGSAAGSEAASDGCNPAPSTLSTDGGHRGLSDALRKGSGEKLSSWDRRSMSPPSTPSELSDADIIAIRDECLPSQGEAFDCVAFARAILIRAGRATVAEDAARYRWLRDNGVREDAPIRDALLVYQGPDSDHSLLPEELDAAIDAARGAL